MTGRALEGEAALVTGGGKGIGRAVVDRFVAEGVQVGVLVRSAADAEDLVRAHGDRVAPVIGDVRSWDDNLRAVTTVVERFGRLDVLVPNAGVYDFSVPFEDQTGPEIAARFDELQDLHRPFALPVQVLAAADVGYPFYGGQMGQFASRLNLSKKKCWR